jgi:hypothetical protein
MTLIKAFCLKPDVARSIELSLTKECPMSVNTVRDNTYGIFDDEDGRQAHLNGQIPAALGQVADDLLAAPPDIKTIDVLAVK